MMMNLYCIKDVKVGFWRPFTQPNDAVALREFDNLVNSGNDSFISQNYSDLELYRIGTFNDENAEVTSSVEYLVKGVDVKKVAE